MLRLRLSVLITTVGVAFRRLLANRRLVAGLLVGFAAAVAASASIPVFTALSLQRMLQAELAASAQRAPASVQIAHFADPRRRTGLAELEAADRIAREVGPDLLGLPVEPFVRYGALELVRPTPVDPGRINPNVERWVSLAFLSELAEHVKVTDGRTPAGRASDGSLEVMVTEEALDKLDLALGAHLWVPLGKAERAPRAQVRIVGLFEPLDPADPYWFLNGPYEQQLFLPEATFRELVGAPGTEPAQYTWFYGLRNEQLQVAGVIPFLRGLYELESRMAQAMPDTELFAGPYELLTRYAHRANELQLLLTLLAVPPLAVVAYFLVLSSGQLVERQRQEIAVLRSRGASLWQVVAIYLTEGGLLAGGALLIGYPAGILLARVMGSAVGFLQFVNRKQPELRLPLEFWGYGLGAAVLAAIAYLLPAIPAARQSIVSFKQESARAGRLPLWARFGLDLLCCGLAGYGYYTLSLRQGGSVEPLHLLAPALAVFGGGLLLLRGAPLVARLASRAVERRGSAPLYLALVQLARNPAGYAPVILLITLTVGMGLYSAAAARTLERNSVDSIWYAGGTDVALTEAWESEASADGKEVRIVAAPPWLAHEMLPGVVQAARVRTEEVVPSVGGRSQPKAWLMAIDPDQFGRAAWFRRDLAPAHFYEYLNLLGSDEEAVLVSRTFLARNNLQPGDRISLTGAGEQELSLVVYGALDYWPTLYGEQGDFFVANLDPVELGLGLQPYQVWLKMAEGAPLQPVLDELAGRGINVVRAADHRQEVIRALRDPQLSGLLGGLTNGFLLAAGITVLGFGIHAALNARSRHLQFGLLRAMGLSRTQLLLTVGLEQLLTVLIGVGAGTGLGLLVAQLFVPFLQQGAASRTPPFQVVSLPADRLRLYLVLLLMLLLGVLGLMRSLGRLRIHEAVKLGEDH